MGFLPRFSNPHFVQQSTQIVSRADLEAEHDVPHEDSEDDDNDVVQALENILKRSLGDFHVGQADPESDGGRDKKRRKKSKTKDIEETQGQVMQAGNGADDEVVEFRLLSKSAKIVSLKPKPAPKIIAVEPAWEDDEREAIQRAERARAAAVDASWILEESQKAAYQPASVDKKLIVVSAEQPIPSTEMMVFEVPRPPQASTSLAAPLKAPPKERPCPHDAPAEKLCCPVVTATVSHAESSSQQRKLKRKKSKAIEPRPPPSFWRPLREWGGKSLGYAMGYEGSRPVPTGSIRQWRYRRDMMKKGVLVA